MKKSLISALVLTLFFSIGLNAQLPTKAEEVSPLLIGETMPNTVLTGTDGKSVAFLELAKEKPTVLLFYRGGWCPYCNAHLAAIGRAEAEILKLGFQVIAVSPDDPMHLQATVEKDSVGYRLFSDATGEFTKAVGIAFQAPERYGKLLVDFSDGKNEGFLPVPAVFVLNKEGEILFEYINPNYKKRLGEDLLLAVLKAIVAEER